MNNAARVGGNNSKMHMSGYTVVSDVTGVMTNGMTDEMVDSVHSLLPRMNYS